MTKVRLLRTSFSVIFIALKFMLATSNEVLSVWRGISVKAVNVFSDEKARLPCFTSEKFNTRSGKIIPDEKRVFWEYTYNLEEEKVDGRAFFISRHVELPPSRYEEKEEVEYTVYADGGDAEGDACVFPFSTHDDHTNVNASHYMCEDAGKQDKRCWCSTVPYHNSATTWGFCQCAFPQPGVTLYAEYGTDPGMPCVFPFHYKERVFHECTREFDVLDRCWCATTQYRDDRKNNKYGFCACAGPPNKGEWSEWDEWTDFQCGKVTYRTRKCMKPKGMTTSIGIGRHLFCDGSSFEFKLSECKDYSAGHDERHIISLQKRTTRAGKTRTDNSISINPTKLDDSSLVMCRITREHLKATRSRYGNLRETVSVYLLNVIDKSKVIEVHLEGEEEQETLTTYRGYQIVYKWEKWGPCNRCGLWKGEQKNAGYCYTKDVRGGRDLPCSSRLLPIEQRKMTIELPNYVAYRQCHIHCVRNIRLIKAIPHVKPPSLNFAVREVIKLFYGDTVRLDCDLNRTEFPSWQFDHPSGRVTTLLNVRENTPMRYIDVLGRLNLVHVQDSVEGYYGCFVEYKLRRTYRIFVNTNISKLQAAIANSPPYIRIGIIILIFGTIAIKVAMTRIK